MLDILFEDFSYNENDDDFPYEDIVDYSKNVLDKENSLIVEFCHYYLDLLNDINNERRWQSHYHFNCICEFYFKYSEFYEKEIDINWDDLEKYIGKIEIIKHYHHDLLNKKIKHKEISIAEKKSKI